MNGTAFLIISKLGSLKTRSLTPSSGLEEVIGFQVLLVEGIQEELQLVEYLFLQSFVSFQIKLPPLFLWQKTKPINQETPLARLGIQLIQAHLSSKKPIVAGQLYKADGVVKSVDKYDDKGSKGIT